MGIHERTLRRWLDEDQDFADRVVRLRSEIVATATGMLADGMSESASVLRDLLASEKEDIRLKAAVKMLELSLKANDLIVLEQRMKALEDKLRSTP